MNELDQARSQAPTPEASPQTEGRKLTGTDEQRQGPHGVSENSVRPSQDSEPIEEAPSEAQNPKSKVRNQKRPYARTAARVAAWSANLKKAQAVPKEKRYKPSLKRRTANLANLAKARAARRQQLEEGIERLDLAFPPLLRVPDDRGISTSDSACNTAAGDAPQGPASSPAVHPPQPDAVSQNPKSGIQNPQGTPGKTREQRPASAHQPPASAQAMPESDAAFRNLKSTIENPHRPFIHGPKIGRNQPCPCGSGRKYKKCHGGPAAVATGKWPTGNPPAGEPVENGCSETEGGPPARENAKTLQMPQAPPLVWAVGWPEGCQGVDRSMTGHAELEKVGETILRRRRAVRRQARREGRQVMQLLTQAAQRTVAPALQEILALACALISILANSRVLERGRGLDQRISRLFDAFLQRRYDPLGAVFDWRGEWRRARALEKEGRKTRRQAEQYRRQQLGLPPLPEPKARPKAKREARTEAPARRKRQAADSPKPAAGPDLPETYSEFRALLGRAFCAPAPEPEDEALRLILDELACVLWGHLTLFSTGFEYGKQNLDEVLDEMGTALPSSRELLIRQSRIQVILKPNPEAEAILGEHVQALRQGLGILMKERYEPDPEMDRFCMGMEAPVIEPSAHDPIELSGPWGWSPDGLDDSMAHSHEHQPRMGVDRCRINPCEPTS